MVVVGAEGGAATLCSVGVPADGRYELYPPTVIGRRYINLASPSPVMDC